MTEPLRAFRSTLLIGWIVLSAAGLLYARWKNIPGWAALPVIAAFLLEYLFYLVPGFAAVRERLAGSRLPLWLWMSGVVPYLTYSLGTGQFHWDAFLRLSVLLLAICFWYTVVPARAIFDLAFLAIPAAALLCKYFNDIYIAPVHGLDVRILGHLATIHTAILAVLLVRGVEASRLGFIPNRQEWLTGTRQFLLFLPFGCPLALAFKIGHVGAIAPVWKIALTFIGFLWVVALSEEFFFRGLLQRWVREWSGNRRLALFATSLVFGAVHLGFRGFPNWKFALVAAVAGWFYGKAYEQTYSVRASMVTHALVATTWRALFT